MRKPFSERRRRVLEGLAAAGTLALLPRSAQAQSGTPGLEARREAGVQASAALLRLPRQALVIGNSRYKESPLKNPANDANAMGESLRRTGFNVEQLLDAGREQMRNAIQAYGEAVAKRSAVGLFYFAGHGVQLAWRNYLIPVDAVVDNPDDVRERAVELNTLLQGLARAKNPMNVIILDACRDNPFGTRVRPDQKGLSQFDAPPGSLLAYATSPGNVASDGGGANSLYTENLLRELQVPEAKIEDVFKRVRLNVRRRSNGQQIPWESTSLEDDFYFLPQKEVGVLPEAIAVQQFDEELAVWEQIRESSQPGPLEDYLRRYPSGRYSELALLRLNLVLARQGEKRIEVGSQAGNPFTRGFERADTNYKVGDFYSYRVLDPATRIEKRRFEGRVKSVTESEVVIGEAVLDRMGNIRRTGDGFRFTDNQNMPLEFYVGNKWTTRYRTFPPDVPERVRIETEMEYRITTRERISVPAGMFDCFRIEGHGRSLSPKRVRGLRVNMWFAPGQVRRFIAHEILRQALPGSAAMVRPDERMELLAFSQT